MAIERIISGMRPTGSLHLGHYSGVLKNWIDLQHEFECLFFVADWHALTTHYDSPEIIEENVWEMVIDWLAAGVDPATATIFIQSKVPEHAELYTLLSMITPLGWLERVPSYKDQQEKLSSKDLSTYGFLGYPLLQSADILIYKATQVPVGEDQIPHIEFTREIARRFNHLYGKEIGFVEKAEEAIKKLGSKKGNLYIEMKTAYQENGDEEALESARVLIEEHQGLSLGDKERLLGFLEGGGKMILVEPEYKLAPASKMIGLDGQKMSKSYNNTIALRESSESVEKKIKTMPTDPARVRRNDPGNPDHCPVWQLHQVYSSQEIKDWAKTGCKEAKIGCIECKQPVIDAINKELKPMQEKASHYIEDPDLVKNIVAEGCEKARKLARETMREVREAMRLNY
ncbi:MAG: tryptophan--tRNA ligase [Candidatus Methylopumilus sp.]|nr:tryptophan--tRNA ligase [Candidatus Methylopumilus sp.]